MVTISGLNVDDSLYDAVKRIVAGTDTGADEVFEKFAGVLAAVRGGTGKTLLDDNRALLEARDRMQEQLNAYHREHPGRPTDVADYKKHLTEIGYIVPEGEAFQVTTQNVDPELAEISAPQLVVPLDNARYALNAMNARWGSLYDALYGTDVVPNEGEIATGSGYNARRGEAVIKRADEFLDTVVGLESGRYGGVTRFSTRDDGGKAVLVATLENGTEVGLKEPEQFAGYNADAAGELTQVLLKNHGIHIELQIDRTHSVGRDHKAGVKDVVLEAAATTILDLEDAVAAVDAADKAHIYSNLHGIMQGTLEASFEKGGGSVHRQLNPERRFVDPDGNELVLPGTSMPLIRNVGIHMYTDAVTTAGGDEVPEGFVDALMTVLIGKQEKGRFSKRGSVYVVKPKQHGPEDVAATVELFTALEEAFGVPRNTVKLGIMDEERRMSLNLYEAIRAARERIIFINTGFLDRTGDEINAVMEIGPVVPTEEMRNETWLQAYEAYNVSVGLTTGLHKVGQIGKGMWVFPDDMAGMLEQKVGHPRAGANTAWVPSPTAATIHAMHYHMVDVAARQEELLRGLKANRVSKDDMLMIPALPEDRHLTQVEIEKELDNIAQGILGYSVRWIDQGVGCSKVPDMDGKNRMEDRATLLIKAKIGGNWLRHNVLTDRQVRDAFARMAWMVDTQNGGDPAYVPMANDLEENVAYNAALNMVLLGNKTSTERRNVEPALHGARREKKSA